MRTAPSALPWRRRPAAVLAGARAVGTLRRSLARNAARALGLRRFARWLRPLTAPPPSLAGDERLGILPALVSEMSGSEGAGGGPSRSGDRGVPGGEAPSRRRPRRLTDGGRRGGGSGARGAGERVIGARQRRSDPGLLLASPPADAPAPRVATVVRRPLPAPPPAPPRRGRTPRRERSAARASARKPAPALPEILAARAARRLATEARAAATGAPSHAPAEEPRNRGAARAGAPDAGAAGAALALQWAAPVAGRAAPPDLLHRLAGDHAPRPISGTPARDAGARAAVALAGGTRDDATVRRSGATVAPATASGPPGPVASPPPLEAIPSDAPPPPVRALAQGGPPGPVASPPPLEAIPSDAPPPAVRALARDVPAGRLGAPAEAAARLRLAQAQDTTPADDLDALAANVKRILDQEARRHGIDV